MTDYQIKKLTAGKRGPWSQSKRKQLREQWAAKMREYNLSHGSGCKAMARAIYARTEKISA